MKFYQLEWWLSKIYPSLLWYVNTNEKELYLTFDDGPIPVVTEFVLQQLETYNAKATFFCVGENIKKHPDIFNLILLKGHSVANHTLNHLKGWKSDNDVYLSNIYQADEVMLNSENYIPKEKILFRPPYGKIKRSQVKMLRQKYKIVMWDVLTRDYDKNIDPEKALLRSITKTSPGSIVVFHDSIKAENNLRYMLPQFMKHFADKGYVFKSL